MKNKLAITFSTLLILFFSYGCCAYAEAPSNYKWVRHTEGLQLGGNIVGIVIDSNSPDTVYALSQSGGVFKTTDGGSNWSEKNSGLTNLSVPWGGRYGNLLTIDPNDSSKLYAAFGGRVYKSTDGAENWVLKSEGTISSCNNGGTLNSLAGVIVDPNSSERLLAATVIDNCTGGVYESVDGGDNWEQIAGKALGGSIGGYGANDAWPIVVDPADSNYIYFAAIHGENMHSTDGGDTWTVLDYSPNSIGQNGSNQLTVHPSNHKVFLAYGDGVLVSADYGDSWSSISDLNGLNVTSVVFSASNNNIAYATTNGGKVYRSVDGGENWVEMSSDSDIHWSTLAVHPTDPTIIYLGSNVNGVYKSTNSGTDVTAINSGITITPYIYTFTQSSADPDIMYTSLETKGLFKSDDHGYTWNSIGTATTFPSTISIEADPNDSEIVLASGASWSDELYRSSDGGNTWSKVKTTDWTIRSIKFAQSDSSIVYLKDDGWPGGPANFLRSVDNGQTWSEVAFFNDKDLLMSNIDVDSSNPDIVYTGTANTQPYKSTDGGDNWQLISTGISESSTYSITVDPNDGSRLIAGTWGDKYYLSTDGGENFSEVLNLGDYSDANPFPASFDAEDSLTVYAGSCAPVTNATGYKSEDGGETWGALPDTGQTGAPCPLLADKEYGGRINAVTGSGSFQVYESYIPKFSRSTFTVENNNGEATYLPNDTLTFTFTLTNYGPAPATNPYVVFVLPAEITYVENSAKIDYHTVSPDPISGSTLTVYTADLDYDKTATITFEAAINADTRGEVIIDPTVKSDEDVEGTFIDNLTIQVDSPPATVTPTPTPTATPTSTPIPTSTPTSPSEITESGTSKKICNKLSPGLKAPWLYGAIAQGTDKIKLYFTEADFPFDHYTLEFGPKSGVYFWGADNFGGPGSRTYLVKSLSPNNEYFFRIRAGNGCAPGNWSNEISAKTKSKDIGVGKVNEAPKYVFEKDEKKSLKRTEPSKPKDSYSEEINDPKPAGLIKKLKQKIFNIISGIFF